VPRLDLQQLFESLVVPMPEASGSGLSAVPIPGAEDYRLAKDAHGAPCLLIRQEPMLTSSAPIRLQNLSVSFGVPCTIAQVGREDEPGTFTIVRCLPVNPGLFPHFLRIISPIVVALGPSPLPPALSRAIAGLVELFQALSAPAKKTIQGIWAELLLIRLARDPRMLALAWHADPTERFDFSAGAQRIEVKSSSSRRREHYFSLEQLLAPRASHVVVASVFVERSGGGVSLSRLFAETRALLGEDASLVARFEAIFYKSLGSGWIDAMDECFDWQLAVESLSVFAAEDVPKVDNAVPTRVTDVRFRSDLGSIAPLTSARLVNLGGIFGCAMPAE
jgi:Putative  PD-(D/E)XK family member, (DUF4420)